MITLAFGVALATSVVGVVNAYLLRPLPFPGADRLFHVQYAPAGQPEPRGMAELDWTLLRDVVDMADASAGGAVYVTDDRYTQTVNALFAAQQSFRDIGVRAVIGRTFTPEDFAKGAEAVALIGQDLWRDRFDSDSSVIGRQLRAYGTMPGAPTENFRIIGVLPRDFRYVRDYGRGTVDVVTPLRVPMGVYLVRLRERVASTVAERRITDVVRRISPSTPTTWSAHLESVRERYVGGLRGILEAVGAATALVLVIVIANLSVLLLLRASRREREVAVRLALGASSLRIFRLLLLEASMICGAAMALGLGLTAVTLRLLAPTLEKQLGRPAPAGAAAIRIDPTVLSIIIGVGIVIALLLSAVPLLSNWRQQLSEVLRRDTRSGSDVPATRRARSAFIALEVAGGVALLAGSGLMVRTVLNLVRTDFGYGTASILRARMVLPAQPYGDTTALLSFYDELLRRVTARPGVQAAAVSNWPPFAEPPSRRWEFANQSGSLEAGTIAISGSYFATLAVPFVEGRAFTTEDRIGSEPVAIVSRSFARQLAPNGPAVGHRLRVINPPGVTTPAPPWRTIVGVVDDVRQSLVDNKLDDVYVPFYQTPSRFAPMFIRTRSSASFWLSELRAVVRELNPDVAVNGTTSLAVEADEMITKPRFLAWLLTAFGIFTALVTMLGVYGVIAYAVHQREREIAIRMAIGATSATITSRFLRSGMVFTTVGVGVGVLGAVAIGRLLGTQLYGVSPLDPVPIGGSCLVMVLAALGASWWPAHKASQRNVIDALREE